MSKIVARIRSLPFKTDFGQQQKTVRMYLHCFLRCTKPFQMTIPLNIVDFSYLLFNLILFPYFGSIRQNTSKVSLF